MNINWLPGKTVGRKTIKIYHFSDRILANLSSISAFSSWCVTSSSFDKELHKKCMALPPPLWWEDKTRSHSPQTPSKHHTFAKKGNSKVELISIFYDSVQKRSLCLESHCTGCCTKMVRDTSLSKSWQRAVQSPPSKAITGSGPHLTPYLAHHPLEWPVPHKLYKFLQAFKSYHYVL